MGRKRRHQFCRCQFRLAGERLKIYLVFDSSLVRLMNGTVRLRLPRNGRNAAEYSYKRLKRFVLIISRVVVVVFFVVDILELTTYIRITFTYGKHIPCLLVVSSCCYCFDVFSRLCFIFIVVNLICFLVHTREEYKSWAVFNSNNNSSKPIRKPIHSVRQLHLNFFFWVFVVVVFLARIKYTQRVFTLDVKITYTGSDVPFCSRPTRESRRANTIRSIQIELGKIITCFVINMAYSWDNRVDFVVRYMYGEYLDDLTFKPFKPIQIKRNQQKSDSICCIFV